MSDFDTDSETDDFPRWTCPGCGEHTVVRVIFGYPDGSLIDAYRRQDIALGGCCIEDDYTGREVTCTACGWQGNHSKNGSKVTAARRRRYD
ncbi:MAG: hypothetical protein ACKOAZ_03500 [Ilumatobacteraceae bacterium]